MARIKSKGAHPDGAVIDALGGTMAAARLTGASKQAVSAWRINGIPARVRLAYRSTILRAERKIKAAQNST